MKFFFHPDHEPRVFDQEEPPEGWFDNPAEFGLYTAPSREQIEEMAARANQVKPEVLPESIAESVTVAITERDKVIAQAEDLGIDLDKRWSTDRIKAAIDDHVNGDSA
jgi:hypothetical protein